MVRSLPSPPALLPPLSSVESRNQCSETNQPFPPTRTRERASGTFSLSLSLSLSLRNLSVMSDCWSVISVRRAAKLELSPRLVGVARFRRRCLFPPTPPHPFACTTAPKPAAVVDDVLTLGYPWLVLMTGWPRPTASYVMETSNPNLPWPDFSLAN